MAKQTIKITYSNARKIGRGSKVSVRSGRGGKSGRRSTAKA